MTGVFTSELGMAPVREWMTQVKEEIQKSPLAKHFCFGFILFCLEKITEVEFACPCNPTWNSWFVSAFFVVPAVIVFLLMCNIQGCKCKKFFWEAFLHSAVPAIVWLILLFTDGRYYACARTSWSGTYELLHKAASQRWCKQLNSIQSSQILTQEWYSQSQFIGIMLALGLTALYQIYLLICYCCPEEETTNEPGSPEEDPMSTTGV